MAMMVKPKSECPFLELLPQETRDQIYDDVFTSMEFNFGDIRGPTTSYVTITNGVMQFRRGQNGLALLRVCRSIRQQIGDAWLNKLALCFNNCIAMRLKLSPSPAYVRMNVRNLTVTSRDPIHWGPQPTVYDVVDALVRLSARDIQLDRLTVLGGARGIMNYDTIESLIRRGTGWKTLHYYLRNVDSYELLTRKTSGTNSPSSNLMFALRTPTGDIEQPSTWQRMMDDRDGRDSAPSVTIYHATQPCPSGPILRPPQAVLFEQGEAAFGSPEQYVGEMLVVVHRGKGVSIRHNT